LSEPNEATPAEPVAAEATTPDATPVAVEATTPDATPDKSSSAENTTPFWKRWLGKR
jgi:hypothetical protein